MLLLLLAACAAPDKSDAAGLDTADTPADTDTDTDSDSDTDSDTDTDPTAACDPDHALRADTPVVTEAVYVADWSYTNWQLDLWLNVNGLAWLAPMSHSVSTWRIRYTTQDRGEVVEATALVSVPIVGAEEELGTVLWLHGTSGFEDACAPSIGAVEGLAPAIVSAGRGYVAVAPDYLGLMAFGEPAPDPHPWIVGEPTAIASLDALRAVEGWLATTEMNARVDRERIVYWGWSEGGYTALQADRWAPGYAPDLAPAGVIAAVPPVDIVGQLAAGTETFGPASAAGALILYLHGEWYGYDGLDVVLHPTVAAALPAEAGDSCTSWPSVDAAVDIDAIYTPAFIDAMATGARMDPWTCVLERSSLPSAAVPYTGTAPVLLVTGTADTLVPPGPVEAAIPALCDEGYAIEHIACDGLEHGEAPVMTLRDQVEWLDARLAGEPPAAGCGVTTPVTCDG